MTFPVFNIFKIQACLSYHKHCRFALPNNHTLEINLFNKIKCNKLNTYACLKLRGKSSFFNYCFVYDNQVAPTITAHCNNIRWDNKCFLSKQDIISISTFPQDYNFLSENIDNVAYICGMSVPPVMIKRVAEN